MKKTILLIIIVMSLSINNSFGQTESEIKNENHHNVDIAFGFGDKVSSLGLSYTYYFALGKKKKFNIGPGLRLMGVRGDDWRIAEENADDGNDGDGDENANAFFSDENRMAALNLGLYLKYEISKSWEIGLNVDVIGFSFGREADGTFVNAQTGQITSVNNAGFVNPNTIFDDGNVGNEMLWVGYRFKEKFLVRLGFNFTGTMYEIPEEQLPAGVDTQNYERLNALGFLGFSYKF